MTAVWIILAALLAVVLLGTVLFLIACRRGPVPDLTKPEVIAKWGRAEQTEEILAGVRLMQDAENIFLPSYDGLRLHGRLLQQPGAKGTILLFHGYRSSWVIDFSIVLPYYFTLGYNLLAVDERAHGESEGTYITFGVRERHDVATWAAYAAMHFGPAHPLILDGLSMGAATVLMASELELPASVRGIIADCGFSSPYAIMKSVLHWRCPWLVSGPLLALTGVSGTFLPELTEGRRIDGIDAVDALVRFLDYCSTSGVVCTEICALDTGYLLQSSAASPLRLQSVWRISTDVNRYYVNCKTGEITKE